MRSIASAGADHSAGIELVIAVLHRTLDIKDPLEETDSGLDRLEVQRTKGLRLVIMHSGSQSRAKRIC
jgi:hypothetical protein